MKPEQHQVVPSEAQMRTAIERRDPAFDQTFVYGVTTTGVFCLPSCASKPARPEHLRFFYEAADARAAGFRACKRCRPLEAAAERERLVALARYIEEHAGDRLTARDLAARAQMTTARLQKRFKAAFGVTPHQFQSNARLRAFKTSLGEGDRVTDAIVDAGYGSTSRVYGPATRNIGMTPRAYRAGGAGETIHYATRASSLGWLMMAATERGVCFVQFGDDADALRQQLAAEFPNAALVASAATDSPALDQWVDSLERHLSERGPRPDLPLDLRGTAFQISVWRHLLSINEGDVISYGELAEGIRAPTAVRAAASACGANRIAVLIPCHRVLRGDGSLGGYRWGIERKRALLDHERSEAAGG